MWYNKTESRIQSGKKVSGEMLIAGKPNLQKALEVLLYVARRAPNIYSALKCIYFADREHLARYGAFIYGDEYVAMNHGPVPSAVFDIIKHVRGDGYVRLPVAAAEAFTVEGHDIKLKRDADTKVLSESERECLDEAIDRFGALDFGALRRISHQDQAYQEADENSFISVESIVRSVGDVDLLELLSDDVD